jgi:FkbM family methyltransferase
MMVTGLRELWLRIILRYPLNLKGRDRLISFFHPWMFSQGISYSVTKNIGDIPFVLDMGDKLQAAMFYATYERYEVDYIRSSLKPGDLFIDVGTHVGYYSVNALNSVCREGMVLCFEPNPYIFRTLDANCGNARKSGYRIFAENKALSDNNMQVELFIYGEANSGYSTIVNSEMTNEQFIKVVNVKCVRLDDYLDANGYPAPAMIKIDIEGAEAFALRGMAEIISRGDKPTLLIEPREKNWDDVLEILQPLGYIPFKCTKGGYLKEIDPLSPNREWLNCCLVVWRAN